MLYSILDNAAYIEQVSIEVIKQKTTSGNVTYHLPLIKFKGDETHIVTECINSNTQPQQYEFIPHNENEYLYFVCHSYNDSDSLTPFDTSTVLVDQGRLEHLFSFRIYSSGYASVAVVRLHNVDKITFTVNGTSSTEKISVVELY